MSIPYCAFPILQGQTLDINRTLGHRGAQGLPWLAGMAHPAAAILAVYHAGLLHCAHILEEGCQCLISVSPWNALDNHLNPAQGLSVLLQHDSRTTSSVKGRMLFDARMGSKQHNKVHLNGNTTPAIAGFMQSSPQTPGLMPISAVTAPRGQDAACHSLQDTLMGMVQKGHSASAAGSWQQRARLQAAGLVRLRMAIAIAAGPWGTAAAAAAAALGPPRVGALNAVLLIVLLHVAVLAVLAHQDLAPSHLLAIEGIHGCHCLSFTAQSTC